MGRRTLVAHTTTFQPTLAHFSFLFSVFKVDAPPELVGTLLAPCRIQLFLGQMWRFLLFTRALL